MSEEPTQFQPTYALDAADAERPLSWMNLRKLLVLMGSGKLGMQVMQQMIGQFKTTMPKVPAKFWADFMKEVRPDDLIDLIVPIYDKHLNQGEVKAIIKFYESPAGKKLTSVLPQITQESMMAGQKWGMALGQKVVKRLQEQGIQPGK